MGDTKAVDRSTIALFWQAALEEKRLLILSVFYPLGTIFMSTVAPLFIGKMLGTLALPGGNPLRYLPYFLVAAAIGLAGNRYGFRFLLSLQAKVMSNLQKRSLETLLRRSVGFHNNNVGGKLVSDAIDFPNAFGMLCNAIFMNLIPFVFVLIIGTSFIVFESWTLGLVIMIMAGYAIISGIRESQNRKPIRQRRLRATKAVTGHLADTILNVQTVKTFAHERTELAQHTELNTILLKQRLHDWGMAATQGNNRMVVLVLMQLAFVITAIILVKDDPTLLGIGIFAFSFTVTISNRLFEVNAMMRSIEEGLLQASPMTLIMQEEVEIRDNKDAAPLRVEKGAINFATVDFSYPDSVNDQTVFTALDLDIAAGEKVGLVGPSGGGKSTLTRLLLRFDDVTGGQIMIDGQNIAGVTQESLRRAVSYVPQEPLLFHRTIRENIAYGQPDATTETVIKAAKQANAHEFISSLPKGYDTLVGERGVKLSGGQRQRVAIARAILKDAPILVLDEATSALDSESEKLIQEALRRLMKGRTTVVIAHRLSTIQNMDRIIVLENGAITEQGTHAELLKKKGTYGRLWAHQSGGFLEE